MAPDAPSTGADVCVAPGAPGGAVVISGHSLGPGGCPGTTVTLGTHGASGHADVAHSSTRGASDFHCSAPPPGAVVFPAPAVGSLCSGTVATATSAADVSKSAGPTSVSFSGASGVVPTAAAISSCSKIGGFVPVFDAATRALKRGRVLVSLSCPHCDFPVLDTGRRVCFDGERTCK